jgi:excinuclease UvrABC helicase subunit UvrB
MAEQLTDYLTDNGVKVRYLHKNMRPLSARRFCVTCGWARLTYWSA